MLVLMMYRICKVENRSLRLKKHVEKYETVLSKMHQKQTELEKQLNNMKSVNDKTSLPFI